MIAKFKMKKAFILPFVLIFVLSLSIIVVNFIENFNSKIKAPVYDIITTKNLIYKNVETILKNNLKNYESTDNPDLKKILNKPILLNDKKNTLKIKLTLSKKSALIDINKIKFDNKLWADSFDDRYETSNAGYLFELIEDIRKNRSELLDNDYRFVQKKIYNLAHLQQIIDYYYEQTGDKNIKKISFSKIFCFDTCEKVFYCNSINKNEDLERLIVNNIEMDYDEEDGFIIDCKNLDTFKNALNKKYKDTFNTKDTIDDKLIGNLTYIVNDVKYKVNFVYNLKKPHKIEEFDVKEI
jgi:hypothetical protein